MAAYRDQYYESADGLRLHYRDYGADRTGVPLLCLPGITRNCRDFEDLAPHLARERRVLSVDFRGRGLSAWDPDWRNYTPPTYVADVVALLDHLAIDRAILLGTSLGGIVAMALAAKFPQRVAGLILNDIGPEIGAAGLARIKQYIGRLPAVSDWEQALQQLRGVYEPVWPGLPDARWRSLVQRNYRDNQDGVPVLDMDPAIGEAARAAAPPQVDPWDSFRRLRAVPMLLVHGASSDILTDDIVKSMRGEVPDMRYIKVANRGHVPLLDEPEALAAIDQFLESFA